MGVWEDGSDRTDINAVARAKSGQDTFDANKNSVVEAERCAGGLERAGYLVTADDFGKVKLFRYPCVVANADGKRYGGHSSHVTRMSTFPPYWPQSLLHSFQP